MPISPRASRVSGCLAQIEAAFILAAALASVVLLARMAGL
jgi:hypothetical protein